MRPLFLQLEPMRQLAEQLKKDRDSALNRVTSLEQEMDKVITKIQVLMQLLVLHAMKWASCFGVVCLKVGCMDIMQKLSNTLSSA